MNWISRVDSRQEWLKVSKIDSNRSGEAHTARSHRNLSACFKSAIGLEGGKRRESHQFSVSGETVFNLYLDLVHVRHDAFSNLALLP